MVIKKHIYTPTQIRGLLLIAGFTIEALARKHGVTRQAVHNTIYGKPSKNLRQAISTTINIPVEKLWPDSKAA